MCSFYSTGGVKGAAIATVFSEFISAIGIAIYTFKRFKQLIPEKRGYEVE